MRTIGRSSVAYIEIDKEGEPRTEHQPAASATGPSFSSGSWTEILRRHLDEEGGRVVLELMEEFSKSEAGDS
jgi:hypothetical protein